jgi:zinc transporter
MTTSWQTKGGGLCWEHRDGRDPETEAWLERQELPLMARIALMAVETRPRCQPLDQGTLINLRGLRQVQDEEGDALVSIRIWAEPGRIISASFRRMAGLEEL